MMDETDVSDDTRAALEADIVERVERSTLSTPDRMRAMGRALGAILAASGWTGQGAEELARIVAGAMRDSAETCRANRQSPAGGRT